MEGNQTGPINLGNPNEFTIHELAEKIRNQINPSLAFIDKPLPQDDPLQRQPVISLAKQHLKWTPNIELDEGLRRTIADFKERIGVESEKTNLSYWGRRFYWCSSMQTSTSRGSICCRN